MNIFITHSDPRLSAAALDDKRVVKMTLETAQIMSTVIRKLGGESVYAPTHESHPCTLWAGYSRMNFAWLAQHGVALAQEYQRRYNKTNPHKSLAAILTSAKQGRLVPEGDLYLPPNCTQFKRFPNPMVSYRHALNWKWFHDTRRPTWTNCFPPDWAVFSGDALVQPDGPDDTPAHDPWEKRANGLLHSTEFGVQGSGDAKPSVE